MYSLTDAANSGVLAQEVIYTPDNEPLPVASVGSINYATGSVHIQTEFPMVYASTTGNIYLIGDSGSVFTNAPIYINTVDPDNRFILDTNEAFVTNTANSMVLSWVGVGGNVRTATIKADNTFAPTYELTNGNFNPTTGVFNLAFNVSVTNVYVQSFTTYHYINIEVGSDIEITYKVVDSDYTITEAGILDAEGNMTVYATFPPVQFYDRYDHVNFNFMVRKV